MEELISKLNNILSSDLTDKGESFAKYSIELGVDPYLAVAIAMHETGCTWNCSYLAKTCNNVGGQKVGEDIIITVSDNGMGIPENEIPLLLTNTDRVHKKGSGVGLVNVNNRIKILFGERYGLHIESELDEGTVVTIKIPAIVYSEENRLQFEEHHIA